jgi:regulator of protease activity HflC (stomatin/prohibitin superfamily)
MEEQAAAERGRRATVTRAEGDKQAQILEAEGRLEASRRDAEAQIVLADASQKAIEMVSAAVGENETPVVYLLGEKYVEALKEVAASDNAKTVVLPADLPMAVRGMMSKG